MNTPKNEIPIENLNRLKEVIKNSEEQAIGIKQKKKSQVDPLCSKCTFGHLKLFFNAKGKQESNNKRTDLSLEIRICDNKDCKYIDYNELQIIETYPSHVEIIKN